ncbi:hypothetical protein JOL79_10560 [Microbispora sp. RL4-1S]|uniref:Uncharacterized protein n=1 Tax=Microbispora oryzae TaxID=2806554 RepID=A0A940WHT7_9ACTN|nr:hypothetical protein [Microbispora oryzae]MBP2704252.1 hypothetical protein [Microbispora oryzae]
MTGLLFRVPAEDRRTLCTHDLTGLHPWGGTRAMVGTNPRAPGDAVGSAGLRATDAAAVPVSQVTWTSAQQITADVPERH